MIKTLLRYIIKINKKMRDLMCKTPLKKCNNGNDTKIIITKVIDASVMLELQIQRVRPESQDDLKTNFFYA